MKQFKKNQSKIMKGLINLTKHKTFKNKCYAIGLILLGLITSLLLEGDITVLIFVSMIAIPLFFSKDNWIV